MTSPLPPLLALRLALAPDARTRLRHLAVLVTAALGCFLLCCALAFPWLALRLQERVEQRGYAAAATPRDAVMVVRHDVMMAAGAAFPVLTIATPPGLDDDPRAIPPGLTALPPVGSAVVSPGLADHGLTAESFGFRTARVGTGVDQTIGPEMVAVASERLLIARVPFPTVAPKEGWARGFSPVTTRLPPPSTPLFPSVSSAALLAGLLGLTSVVAVYGAGRGARRLSRDRVRTLALLGFDDAVAQQVGRLGVVVVTAVGAATGWAGWWWVSGASPTLRLADTVLAPERLGLPWPVEVLVVAAVVAVGDAAGRHTSDPIPPLPQVSAPTRWGWLRWVPFPAGVAMTVATGWWPGLSPWWWVAGVATTMLGLPLLVLPLSLAMGRAVRGSDGVSGWLTGALTVAHARRLARPAALLGVSIVGALAVASSSAALTRHVVLQPTHLYAVSWDDGPTTVAKLARKYRLSQFFVVDAKGAAVLPRCGVITTGGDARNICFNPQLNASTQAFFGRLRMRVATTPLDVNAPVDGRVMLIPTAEILPYEAYARFAPTLGLSVTPVDGPGPDVSGTVDDWVRLTLYLCAGMVLVSSARWAAVRGAEVVMEGVPRRGAEVEAGVQSRAQAAAVRIPLRVAVALGLVGGWAMGWSATSWTTFPVLVVTAIVLVVTVVVAATLGVMRRARVRQWATLDASDGTPLVGHSPHSFVAQPPVFHNRN